MWHREAGHQVRAQAAPADETAMIALHTGSCLLPKAPGHQESQKYPAFTALLVGLIGVASKLQSGITLCCSLQRPAGAVNAVTQLPSVRWSHGWYMQSRFKWVALALQCLASKLCHSKQAPGVQTAVTVSSHVLQPMLQCYPPGSDFCSAVPGYVCLHDSMLTDHMLTPLQAEKSLLRQGPVPGRRQCCVCSHSTAPGQSQLSHCRQTSVRHACAQWRRLCSAEASP